MERECTVYFSTENQQQQQQQQGFMVGWTFIIILSFIDRRTVYVAYPITAFLSPIAFAWQPPKLGHVFAY